jgi:hypothetical protein
MIATPAHVFPGRAFVDARGDKLKVNVGRTKCGKALEGAFTAQRLFQKVEAFLNVREEKLEERPRNLIDWRVDGRHPFDDRLRVVR